MAEYIKRESLIENLNKFAPEQYNALVDMIIRKQPVADVVEVVRCKDCQYGKGNDYEGSVKVPFMYHCTYDDLSYNGADHFCSYGKRKEGAEE